MPEIKPFRGWFFDAARVALPEAVAPPYDIVSPDEHRQRLERSDVTILRVTLGDTPGLAEPTAAAYQERAERLHSWRSSGVIAPDTEPSVYLYEVDYPVPFSGERRKFRGFVSLIRLERPRAGGAIRPHELTFPKVVTDRRRLLEATRAQLGQLLLIYDDPSGRAPEVLDRAPVEPVLEVEVLSGEVHRLGRIGGSAAAELADALRPLSVTIGDGHHRFQTAVEYAEAHPDDPDAAWRMVTLAELRDPGLSLLPTHRLVSLSPGADRREVLARLRKTFPDAQDGEGFRVYTPESPAGARLAVPEALRRGRRGVKATVPGLLHELFLDRRVGPETPDGTPVGSIEYLKDPAEGRARIEAGSADLFLELPAVGAEEFREAIELGEVFPHKTTFFYPKLYTGLVFRLLDG